MIQVYVWYDIGYKRFDLEDKSLLSESLKFVCVVSISRYFVKKKRINCEIIIWSAFILLFLTKEQNDHHIK